MDLQEADRRLAEKGVEVAQSHQEVGDMALKVQCLEAENHTIQQKHDQLFDQLQALRNDYNKLLSEQCLLSASTPQQTLLKSDFKHEASLTPIMSSSLSLLQPFASTPKELKVVNNEYTPTVLGGHTHSPTREVTFLSQAAHTANDQQLPNAASADSRPCQKFVRSSKSPIEREPQDFSSSPLLVGQEEQ